METINTMILRLEENLATIKSEWAQVTEQKFVYTRAKNIRKAAQATKKAAQDLRLAVSIAYKSANTKE